MGSSGLHPAAIDWMALGPLIGVCLTGVVAMVLEMWRPRMNNNGIVGVCIVGLLVSGFLVIANWNRPGGESFGADYSEANGAVGNLGLFINDRLGQVIQLLIVGITLVTVLFSEGYLREKRLPFGEYYPLVLWSAAGGMVMATTRDLLIFFLGLETLSIALYVLAGLSSMERRSQEAALKYFLLGAFASSFLLYGIALIYGATGTTHLSGIAAIANTQPESIATFSVLYAGIGLVLVGFAFKVALVPFHMWTPDVYQGAPTSVVGFMAAGVKVAAFAAMLRFIDVIVFTSSVWITVLAALAAVTMTIGNLIALAQKDAKRILAYSSIAHAGYILVAVVAYGASKSGPYEPLGQSTVAYYLAMYGFMTLGAFAVLSLTGRDGKEGSTLEDYYGLYRSAPFPAAMFIVFMASLAGIPLTGGFLGKFLIFRDALSVDMLWLALLLGVNSVISVAYYLRIVQAVCTEEPGVVRSRFAPVNAGLFTACAVCAFLLIAGFVAADPLFDWMGLSAPGASVVAGLPGR